MKTLLPQTKSLVQEDWFSHWFDSPYYHILYKNRDYQEAQLFVEKMTQFLDFQSLHKILDLACGKGRYAINLNQKGFEVVGVDLSPENIASASQFTNERLRFYVHDMRNPLPEHNFDFILNLFTSFGYFESEIDNLKVIQSITNSLKKEGKLVVDFFNPTWVLNNMLPYESKIVEGIHFEIRKELIDNMIVKTIEFQNDNKTYVFQERVKAIDLAEFEHYFAQANLQICDIFGNYQLDEFHPEKSERMILIAQKIA